MKTIETKLERRSKREWPPGPWDSEPDKRQWVDEATGLPCLIVRHMECGHLCGYVGVSKGHPLFEVDDGEIWRFDGKHKDLNIEVHGCLTYSAHCSGSICHEVEPGDDDHVWWFGFDCAHSGDAGAVERMISGGHDRYRDFPYVANECRNLARQLHAIGRDLNADST